MPDEIEVPLEHAQEHIEEAHEEQHGEGEGARRRRQKRRLDALYRRGDRPPGRGRRHRRAQVRPARQRGPARQERRTAQRANSQALDGQKRQLELLPGRRAEGADLSDRRPEPAARLARGAGRLGRGRALQRQAGRDQKDADRPTRKAKAEEEAPRPTKIGADHGQAPHVRLLGQPVPDRHRPVRRRRPHPQPPRLVLRPGGGLLGVAALLGGFLGLHLPFAF